MPDMAFSGKVYAKGENIIRSRGEKEDSDVTSFPSLFVKRSLFPGAFPDDLLLLRSKTDK